MGPFHIYSVNSDNYDRDIIPPRFKVRPAESFRDKISNQADNCPITRGTGTPMNKSHLNATPEDAKALQKAVRHPIGALVMRFVRPTPDGSLHVDPHTIEFLVEELCCIARRKDPVKPALNEVLRVASFLAQQHECFDLDNWMDNLLSRFDDRLKGLEIETQKRTSKLLGNAPGPSISNAPTTGKKFWEL